MGGEFNGYRCGSVGARAPIFATILLSSTLYLRLPVSFDH